MKLAAALLALCSCAFDVGPSRAPWRPSVSRAADEDTGVCEPDAAAIDWVSKHAGDYGCVWSPERALFFCTGGTVQLTVHHASEGITRAARWDADRERTHELLCGCHSCVETSLDGGL